MINPTTGMTGGYTGQMSAGIDPLQQSALNQVPNAVGAWGDNYAAGNTMMQNAGTASAGLGVFDPAKMQQQLNPYLSGVNDQIATLGNRNLMEKILPEVNSTFAGNGQFGSTRNGDFTNRAIRDNQQAISNAQGTAMNQAYNQAATNNLAWNTAGQAAANGALQAGQNIYTGALQAGQQNWNDLSNTFNMGAQNRAVNQEGLTADFNNWQNTWNMPLDAMGKMGGVLNQLKSGINPTTQQVNTTSADPNSALYSWLTEQLAGIAPGTTQ
jgi:hypothetical protein